MHHFLFPKKLLIFTKKIKHFHPNSPINCPKHPKTSIRSMNRGFLRFLKRERHVSIEFILNSGKRLAQDFYTQYNIANMR